jgi:hypothetical protein
VKSLSIKIPPKKNDATPNASSNVDVHFYQLSSGLSRIFYGGWLGEPSFHAVLRDSSPRGPRENWV